MRKGDSDLGNVEDSRPPNWRLDEMGNLEPKVTIRQPGLQQHHDAQEASLR
jgi:hypothetical protein